MGYEVKIESHKIEIENACKEQIERALTAIGIQCVSIAQTNIETSGRRGEGRMIGSITSEVVMAENSVYIGSDLEYALYNEVGTGIYAEGGGGRKDPWVYRDDKGDFHTTVGMKPIHFLKRAVFENVDEYRKIAEQYLKE